MSETSSAVLQSFVYSFAFTTAVTGNPGLGACGGLIAATASAVHSFTAPLFAKIFNKRPSEDFKWYEHFSRVVVCLSAALLTAHVLGVGVHLIGAIALTCIVMVALNSNRSMELRFPQKEGGIYVI